MNNISILDYTLNNDIEGVKKCIEDGISINYQYSTDGATALHIACSRGNLRMVKFLIDNGANVNKQDNNGFTPLMCASFNNCKSTVIHLVHIRETNLDLQSKNGSSALLFASRGGSLDIVKILVEFRANIELEDYMSFTATTIASYNGHINVLRYLLDIGVNPNKISTKFFTVYSMGTQTVKEFLIRRYGENGILTLSPKQIRDEIYSRLLATSGSTDICAICTGKLNEPDILGLSDNVDIVKLTNCVHEFHKQCILKWTKTPHHISCPVCRTISFGKKKFKI